MPGEARSKIFCKLKVVFWHTVEGGIPELCKVLREITSFPLSHEPYQQRNCKVHWGQTESHLCQPCSLPDLEISHFNKISVGIKTFWGIQLNNSDEYSLMIKF